MSDTGHDSAEIELDPCDFLSWDSEFFGLRIGRVRGERLDESLAAQVDQWRRQNRIDCLYFMARCDDAVTTRTAEEFGYRLADIRVTLDHAMKNIGGGAVEARPVRESDMPVLKSIARGSFYDSRFYFDGNFPREKCDELYELWLTKAVQRANEGKVAPASEKTEVLVVERSAAAAGFITCDITRAADAIEGSIGLIGVAADQQGKGVGSGLVQSALRWFSNQGARHVSVVTQGRNVAAQRLYQQCGFKTRKVQLYYHRWYRP